jgi:hypothetical protein
VGMGCGMRVLCVVYVVCKCVVCTWMCDVCMVYGCVSVVYVGLCCVCLMCIGSVTCICERRVLCSMVYMGCVCVVCLWSVWGVCWGAVVWL